MKKFSIGFFLYFVIRGLSGLEVVFILRSSRQNDNISINVLVAHYTSGYLPSSQVTARIFHNGLERFWHYNLHCLDLSSQVRGLENCGNRCTFGGVDDHTLCTILVNKKDSMMRVALEPVLYTHAKCCEYLT